MEGGRREGWRERWGRNGKEKVSPQFCCIVYKYTGTYGLKAGKSLGKLCGKEEGGIKGQNTE